MNKNVLKKISTLSNIDIYAVIEENKLVYLLTIPRTKKKLIKFNIYLENNLSNKKMSSLCKASDNYPYVTLIPFTKNAYLEESLFIKDANNISDTVNDATKIFLKMGYTTLEISNIINIQSEYSTFTNWFHKQIPSNITINNLLEIKESPRKEVDDLFNTNRFKTLKKEDVSISTFKQEELKSKELKQDTIKSGNIQSNVMNYNLVCILIIISLTCAFILRGILFKL